MADSSKRLNPIPLSDLPEISDSDVGKYWVFGSTEKDNGSFESGRYNLGSFLNDAQQSLQLQRRVALTMERDEHLVPIGEPMTIYLAKAHNVSKLEIKSNDPAISTWQMIPLNENIEIDISDSYDLRIRIERTSIDTESTVYLFAKVKTE